MTGESNRQQEQYEEALFASMMKEYLREQGQQALEEEEQRKKTSDFEISQQADERMRQFILQHTSSQSRQRNGRKRLGKRLPFKAANRNGRKKIACAAAAILFAAAIWSTAGTADSFRHSGETKQIQNAYIQAQDAALEIGKFSFDGFSPVTGKSSDLSEEERTACIKAYTDKVNQYYAKDNPVRQQYIDLHALYVNDVCRKKVDYVVDSGVLDSETDEISFSKDRTQATMDISFTIWNKSIEQTESGKYAVSAPVNKVRATVVMVKEDGNWKFLKSTDSFVDDGMTDAWLPHIKELFRKKDTSDAGWNRVQRICGTEYDTFAEALRAAGQIHADEANPYT